MAAPVWTTALPDWERRILARESLIPFKPLFPAEAQAALATMDQLKLVDVVGQPLFGQVAQPWVREFAASVFGAYDPESGRRLVREWMLLISKKNGKSTIAGLLMLTLLILNWRQAGEFGILAPTVEVANNAFRPAADAIRADEELSAMLHVQDHIRTITHRITKATLQVVAAESETVAGKKWIVTLVDELWLFGKKANAEDMLREATGGLVSRPEGCVIWLSTHSNEAPAGVFAKKLKYARRVRDGEIEDPTFCPVLYEYPPRMLESKAYANPENWYVTNPNLGSGVSLDELKRIQKQEEDGGESGLRGFYAKHLNVEVGVAMRSDRWTGADYWKERGDKNLTLSALIERSDVITLGLDGGGEDDLFGLCVLGRDAITGEMLAVFRAWVQEKAVERRKSEASKYKDFEADGHLKIIPCAGEDMAGMIEIARQLVDSGKFFGAGLDTACVDDIHTALTSDECGVESSDISSVPQNFRLASAIKTIERRLSSAQFTHDGSRLMEWCVGNAKVEVKANGFYITKQASGTAKIDPLMALFAAAMKMAFAPAQNVIGADYEMVAA